MNFVVLAILFILSGFSMKYSDDYFDVGHNNKLAIIFGIVCAVASSLATIWDAGSAYIFIAILIGNLLALKVDGKHHIATLIVYVLICIICGIPELSIAVLIIAMISALLDEIGHEKIGSITNNKYVNLFFEYRCVMKVVILLLALFGAFGFEVFLLFLLFELSYELAGLVYARLN